MPICLTAASVLSLVWGAFGGASEHYATAGKVSTALGCRTGDDQARRNHCHSHCRNTVPTPAVSESGRMLKNWGGFSGKP